MDSDKVKCLQKTCRAKKRKIPCLHRRMVSYLYDEDGKATENLVCMECGEIVQDSLKKLN